MVGGGASAVQLLGEIAPVAGATLWVTRSEPVGRSDDVTPEVGRAAVALVEDRVRRGLPPASVVMCKVTVAACWGCEGNPAFYGAAPGASSNLGRMG
jgi:cation diffusion facilitator CzcD-associated flavoprotein CzcO